MQITTTEQVCAFCGTKGDQETLYAAGFGVVMCDDCVGYFHTQMSATHDGVSSRGNRSAGTFARRPVDDLKDDEMLDMLPRIAGTAQQVNRFMADWVEQIRDRRMSWTAIGNAMGISRQAAWERFTRVLGTERKPVAR